MPAAECKVSCTPQFWGERSQIEDRGKKALLCTLICAPILKYELVCGPKLKCPLIYAPKLICALVCAPKIVCVLIRAHKLVCAPKILNIINFHEIKKLKKKNVMHNLELLAKGLGIKAWAQYKICEGQLTLVDCFPSRSERVRKNSNCDKTQKRKF